MKFFESVLSVFSVVPDWMYFSFPPLLWLVFSLVYLFVKEKKGYLYFSALLHTLLFTCALLKFTVRDGLLLFSISLFFSLLFAPMAKYPLSKRKKKEKRKKQDPVTAFRDEYFKEEDSLLPTAEPPKPQKILVGGGGMATGEDTYSLEKENISLNHVLGVALQLKRANLNVADRLETDNIFKTLSLYRAKNNLTKEEVDSLNGYLSTLLKLMAKYSL